MSAAKLRLEKTSNIAAKKRETAANARSSLALPRRSAPAATTAIPSVAQPSAVEEGPRVTDASASPGSRTGAKEGGGTRASRSRAAWRGKQGAGRGSGREISRA